jgi:hypothetical protein
MSLSCRNSQGEPVGARQAHDHSVIGVIGPHRTTAGWAVGSQGLKRFLSAHRRPRPGPSHGDLRLDGPQSIENDQIISSELCRPRFFLDQGWAECWDGRSDQPNGVIDRLRGYPGTAAILGANP